MNTLTQAPQNTSLTLQNCGYKIEGDRVIISIQRIANDRTEGNLSGTLRLQLCASDSHSEKVVLASTTIGEIKGQHFLIDCYYDLLFQQPPTGTWQLALQLSEWDGAGYIQCDLACFDTPYQIQASPTYSESAINIDEAIRENLVPTPKTPTKQKTVIDDSAGYTAINKSKVETLLKIKGVPKKILGKLVAERPFHSEKAVLNIKGMGPTMLNKILSELIR